VLFPGGVEHPISVIKPQVHPALRAATGPAGVALRA